MHPFKHFITITKHRHKVIYHCFKLGIGFQGLFHDLSKYSFVEFYNGAKYYQGTRSPNEKERELYGYSKAWLHHKGINKHHFEYWNDVNPATNQYEPVEMPLRYVKEMFADRLAASKTYLRNKYSDDQPLEYFVSHNTRDKMHKETAKLLQSWLILLSLDGEKKAFKTIKKIKTLEQAKKMTIKND